MATPQTWVVVLRIDSTTNPTAQIKKALPKAILADVKLASDVIVEEVKEL